MTQKQITDIKIGSNSAIKAMLNNEIVWPHVEKINTEDYMTIEILEDDSYINLRDNDCYSYYVDEKTIYYNSVLDGYLYCINGDGVWINNFDSENNTSKLKAGDKVSFKKTMSSATKEIAPKFNVYRMVNNEVVKATYNLSGNCMSIIYGDDAKNHYSLIEYPCVFYRMFNESKVINVSPNFLPATTLSESCYREMFYRCYFLTEAPELPATLLKPYCYYGMFRNCESLTKAPELPATTLVDFCYSDMFAFCTSLTKAPELPATTLVERCYEYMFVSCSVLSEITALFDSFGDAGLNATTGWVSGVSLSGTFTMNRDANWDPYLEEYRGPSRVPEDWSVVYY